MHLLLDWVFRLYLCAWCHGGSEPSRVLLMLELLTPNMSLQQSCDGGKALICVCVCNFCKSTLVSVLKPRLSVFIMMMIIIINVETLKRRWSF